jgi:chromosome segregation ATPase
MDIFMSGDNSESRLALELAEMKAKYNFMVDSAQINAKERDKLQQELDAARTEIERLNDYTIKGYEEMFDELKKQLADAQTEFNALRFENTTLSQTIQELNAELDIARTK